MTTYGYCVPVEQPRQEIDFFNLIKSDCEIIFDVGSREDIDYIVNSYDSSRQFHLFDPDATFLNKIEKKINDLKSSDRIENLIYLNAFGLGENEGSMVYYSNTQSFVFRTVHTISYPSTTSFPTKTIKGYCEENSIKNIDFLKIDIEGMEIDCLRGGEEIINSSCKYVQFEFASTMMDRKIDPEELINFFQDSFDLFLLQVDPAHPYYTQNKNLLTPLSDQIYNIIKKDMYEASGCNLVAIKKNISEKYK